MTGRHGPFGPEFSFDAFATAVDPGALCRRLAAILTERVRGSDDASAEFESSMKDLRALGHDLWSWDSDLVWGHDYITRRPGAGLRATRIDPEDDAPSEQRVEVAFEPPT